MGVPTSRFTLHAIHLSAIAAVCVCDCPSRRRCVKGYFTMSLAHARVLDAEVALCRSPHRVFRLLCSYTYTIGRFCVSPPLSSPSQPTAMRKPMVVVDVVVRANALLLLPRARSVCVCVYAISSSRIKHTNKTHAHRYFSSPHVLFVPRICTLFPWKDPQQPP